MFATSGKRRNALLKAACGAIAIITTGLPATVLAQNVAAQNSTASQSQYQVNAGDELDVFVWGEERLQRPVRVQPDGTFSLPLAGTIKAAGQNVIEIAAQIRERIAGNYRSAVPDVTVSVRDAAGTRFYVVGKVRTPGGYTSGTPINILQALSMAGGTEEFADIKNAVILRRTPTGQVVEPVKLSTILKGGRGLNAGNLKNPLPILLSGDVLVIP